MVYQNLVAQIHFQRKKEWMVLKLIRRRAVLIQKGQQFHRGACYLHGDYEAHS